MNPLARLSLLLLMAVYGPLFCFGLYLRLTNARLLSYLIGELYLFVASAAFLGLMTWCAVHVEAVPKVVRGVLLFLVGSLLIFLWCSTRG